MRIVAVIVVAVGLGGGWPVVSLAQSPPTLVNAIVAVVNDKVITREDIESAIVADEELLIRQYGRQAEVLAEKREALRRDALELLVENELILHEFEVQAETAGFKFPENVIEEYIRSTIRRRYGDRLRLILSLQARGMNYESYRKQVREDFIIRAMTGQNIASGILISPFKIENYYASHQDQFQVGDQVKLRMIVLANKADRGPEATKKLAAEILAKLESGTPFAEMASLYSDGSQRSEGGDWGWIEKPVLRPDLAEVAFSLKPGERSALIEKPEGCFLMLVEEARAAHVRPLTEARDDIEKALRAQEEQRLRKEWIDRLKAKSFIKYVPLN
jgi:peptidyl-prolyl cis-trans isomerase SurA